ncbi:unnamed protein product [Cladocopium goreaui]|uniref:Uncharacterized protein n=1 Tax=Cladocopium goreaui TaxID=2562237 RepID=A0A9P1GA60_9DINO|nr:unnamed protein product [Cladocopium goreaui]
MFSVKPAGFPAENQGLFDVLGDILQQAMESPGPWRQWESASRSQADNGEILPFLLAFSEAASKLKVPELVALKSLVAAGRGWRSVLLEEPTPDSLHLPCLRLLDALMASPELFAMAHQAESQENVLLAAADLLVLPSVAEDERDTLEKQKCRVAALKLFSRCCATASLDFVLQLRAEEGMDTVLQSLVLLCHHELLCLLMYGNPWRNEDLEESRKHRLQAVDTSLFLLASLAWQLSPLKDGLETEKWTIEGRVPREAQFGRRGWPMGRWADGDGLGNGKGICYGKSPFFRGKSTISMANFDSKLLNYQRVPHALNIIENDDDYSGLFRWGYWYLWEKKCWAWNSNTVDFVRYPFVAIINSGFFPMANSREIADLSNNFAWQRKMLFEIVEPFAMRGFPYFHFYLCLPFSRESEILSRIPLEDFVDEALTSASPFPKAQDPSAAAIHCGHGL